MLALSYGFPRGYGFEPYPARMIWPRWPLKEQRMCHANRGRVFVLVPLLTIRGQVKDYCPIRDRFVLNELSLIFSEARNEQVRFA